MEFGIVNRGIYRGMAQKTGRFSTFYSPRPVNRGIDRGKHFQLGLP